MLVTCIEMTCIEMHLRLLGARQELRYQDVHRDAKMCIEMPCLERRTRQQLRERGKRGGEWLVDRSKSGISLGFRV